MDNFTYKNINVLEHWKFSYIALISADAFIEIHIYLHIRLEYSTWATPVIRLWLANSRIRSRIGNSLCLFSRVDSSLKPIQWSSSVCIASGNSSVASSSAGGKSLILSIWWTLKPSTFRLMLLLAAWNCWPSQRPTQLSRLLEYTQPQSLAFSRASTASVTSFSSRFPFMHRSTFSKSSNTVSSPEQLRVTEESLSFKLCNFCLTLDSTSWLCSICKLCLEKEQ